jgi:hypothetical protein
MTAPMGRVEPEEAARQLFQEPDSETHFVARDEVEAARAVDEYRKLFDSAAGVFKQALDGARAGAETLSHDLLQGLAEIIQNADDAGATFVQFSIEQGSLVAQHDGRRVSLSDVLSLATPWLSNKSNDAAATGRYGIGLMTLRAISDVLEVHSSPYHLCLGEPTISAIDSARAPTGMLASATTAMCVPLQRGSVTMDAICEWIDRWDDSALLFLQSVRRVSVVGGTGDSLRTLRLTWVDEASASCMIAGSERDVRRRRASAPDGRAWLVHSAEAPKPKELERVRKASQATVPLGLALPLQPGDPGAIYAGLPLTATTVPVRINAQFDPVTSRKGLAPTDWNEAMVPLLADLWVEVVEDLFAQSPDVAWDVVPLPDEDADGDAGPVVSLLESLLLDRARDELAARVRVPVDGQLMGIDGLAVEDHQLEGIVEPAEIAELAGLEAALPSSGRDGSGRWRLVLGDWRDAGADIPDEVSVEDAMVLFDDLDRPVVATVRLAAACIDAGLSDDLAELPCIVAANGDRLSPPAKQSLHAILIESSPLAETLGIGLRLDASYLVDEDAARTVVGWLRASGAVLADADAETVVRRLGRAGIKGEQLDGVLSDEQLRTLRDAIEMMEPSDRAEVGRGVGMAIRIGAFRYGTRGQREEISTRPCDVYLPKTIDREPDSFAVAAGKTPGLVWAAGRYSEQLKSSIGRGGLGPQKFLGLLGAERGPRFVPHASLYSRYSDPRRGLAMRVDGSPNARAAALLALGATYTLDDVDSPDLRAVVEHIANERKVGARRLRAVALLSTLSRQWDRVEELSEVIAAVDYNGWQTKGRVPAFWAWAVGAVPWLDDTFGAKTAPLDLRIRTAATIAVHGSDAAGYLRPEYDRASRPDVLATLGVSGEPSTADLVDRLRALRAARPQPDSVDIDSTIIYQALADRLSSRSSVPGDLGERDLRQAFAEGDGLIFTNLGWQPPSKVLVGPAIFRGRWAFVPQGGRTDRLWRLLRLRQPSLDDGIKVIGQLARRKQVPVGDDLLVLLETLRLLQARVATATEINSSTRRRLAGLAVWTSKGWTTERPVYAVEDPTLLTGLSEKVAVWDPGGDLSQFADLLELLRITPVSSDAARVVEPEQAVRDGDATELFSLAVGHLQEDLARNAPAQAAALTVTWADLNEFEVRVDPDLRVVVDELDRASTTEVRVQAKLEAKRGALFLECSDRMRHVDAGGSAVASLFKTASRRQVSQAWLAACVAAEDGRQARRLELAEQRAAEEQARREREMAERTEAFGKDIKDRHKGRGKRKPPAGAGARPDPAGGSPAEPAPRPRPAKPRVLVDPSRLGLVDADGSSGAAGGRNRKGRKPGAEGGPLPAPNRKAKPPRSRSGVQGFTPNDKESVGLELARIVLGGDAAGIVDIRSQHGVGADAIDELDRFFELKVHLGDEPDTIRMEESQIRRAMSTPDFFLVVVSNVEGANAKPKVRIIVDPVHQLQMTESSAVSFTGVRSAEHSLVYMLEPTGDEDDGEDAPSDSDA